MAASLNPLSFLVACLSGCPVSVSNAGEYLTEENRVLREQIGEAGERRFGLDLEGRGDCAKARGSECEVSA